MQELHEEFRWGTLKKTGRFEDKKGDGKIALKLIKSCSKLARILSNDGFF
jgi:hypothetical protein